MRILGWMHRKLRQNTPPDPLKDFHIGRASVDGCKPALTRAASNHYADYLKPFPGIDAAKEDEEETMFDLFTHWHHGFLAIGTLGVVDPVEPTPDLETEPEKNLENEVDHLEKAADKKESTFDGGSGVCHLDAEKTVDPTEDVWSTYSLNPVHDPQVDGSGSQVEVEKVPVPKKERRISLGELFSKSKRSKGAEPPGYKAGKMKEPKATHLVKKILNRRAGSSMNSGSTDNAAPENKFHKLFHMFNRKVHPSELCVTTKKCSMEEIKNREDYDMLDDKDNFIHVDPVTGKEKIRRHKSQPIPPAFTICGSDSSGSREYWIKTDADYLVLEL